MKRARDYFVFKGLPGALNAITDVQGLEVGMVTLVEGDGPLVVGKGPIRTGVTAILPRGKRGVGQPCAAGILNQNGNGEMTGSHWINESGWCSRKLQSSHEQRFLNLFSNCRSSRCIVWSCADHKHPCNWALPLGCSRVVPEKPSRACLVAARCRGDVGWDFEVSLTCLALCKRENTVCLRLDSCFNSDINGFHVKPQHAIEAIDTTKPGPVLEGSVGGGTGMNCYSFKGGSGTASRLVPFGPQKRYTVGTFLQCNFGSRNELNFQGVPLGDLMTEVPNPIDDGLWLQKDLERLEMDSKKEKPLNAGAGSVIVIVATDAPLLPDQCRALARRVPLGLAKTGTFGGHFSGDIFLAFSTADQSENALDSNLPSVFKEPSEDDLQTLKFIPWARMDPFFEAVVQCVEVRLFDQFRRFHG